MVERIGMNSLADVLLFGAAVLTAQVRFCMSALADFFGAAVLTAQVRDLSQMSSGTAMNHSSLS